VEYQNLYPGITVRYYGTQHKMEHDFRIVPGADPSTIRLQFHGITNLRKTQNGDLRFEVDGIPMTQTLPVAYQVIGTRKQRIRADYVLLANNQVGFAVHNWDGKHLLVIDPILANSTYLGGDTQQDSSLGVTLAAETSVSSISSDSKENVYITGTTTAIDFPVTNGAFQTTPNFLSQFHADTVSRSGFVTKLGKFGALIYSTYLLDSIAAGSVSPDGHVYIAKNGFDNFSGPGIGIDPGVRIVKLSLDGSKILYDYTYAGSSTVNCSGFCTEATSVAATASNPATIASWAAIFAAASGAGAADAPVLMVAGVGIGSLCWVTLLAGGTAAARRAVGARAIRTADVVAGAGLIAFGVALAATAG